MKRATPSAYRLVSVGGGGGQSSTLPDLVWNEGKLRPNLHVTAITTVFDNGRHSGHLRRHQGVMALGDMRNLFEKLSNLELPLILAASRLCDIDAIGSFSHLLNGEYKFANENLKAVVKDVSEISIGNLIFAEFIRRFGVKQAILYMHDLYRPGATICPVSLNQSSHLVAFLNDGSRIRGEDRIDERVADGRHIANLMLVPKAHLCSEAREALIKADMIVFGPGDLWTSILPNLLVEGFLSALLESRAKIAMIVNLVNKPGQTDGYTTVDYVKRLCTFLKRPYIDLAICNDEKAYDATILPASYREKGMTFVPFKKDGCARKWDCMPLLGILNGQARHNRLLTNHLIEYIEGEKHV